MRREQLCECSRLDRSTFLSKSPLQTGEVDRQQEKKKRSSVHSRPKRSRRPDREYTCTQRYSLNCATMVLNEVARRDSS